MLADISKDELAEIAGRFAKIDCCGRDKTPAVTRADLERLGVWPFPAMWMALEKKVMIVPATGWKSRCAVVYEKLFGPYPWSDFRPSCEVVAEALRRAAGAGAVAGNMAGEDP